MLTFEERKEKMLKEYDVDLLTEVLQISADELLERFEDRLALFFDREDEE